jgi:hypothetical protein
MGKERSPARQLELRAHRIDPAAGHTRPRRLSETFRRQATWGFSVPIQDEGTGQMAALDKTLLMATLQRRAIELGMISKLSADEARTLEGRVEDDPMASRTASDTRYQEGAPGTSA